MSYILDALRKSDQQRRRGAVPTLPTALATITVLERPALLHFGLLGVGLIVIGFAVGWLRPWRAEFPESLATPIVSNTTNHLRTTTLQDTPPFLDEGPSPRVREPGQIQSIMTRTFAPESNAPVPERKVLAAAATRLPGKQGESSVAAAAETNVSAARGQADERQSIDPTEPNVMTSPARPMSTPAALPPMSVAVHAYSNKPQDRLVSINERVLREGDYLAPDLRLEQITPDGMIFNYRGNRVQRGTQ
jgi:hypothetical protein